MNILHITTFLQGGAGKIVKDIAYEQKKNGNNVFVVTTHSEEPGYCNYKEYIDFLYENNIKVYKFDSTFKRDIYLNLNVADKVRKILINENIDVIHTHAAVPSIVGIVARAGMKKYIPIIQTMHGWGTNKRPEHERMDITIMNGLDKIVSVSKSDKKFMVSKGIDENKIVTIYNGVSKSGCYGDIDDVIKRDIVQKKNNGYTILGSIGSVCSRKNQELLVDAISKISDNIKIYAVIIGEGDIIKKLEEKVHDYGIEEKIKFYGYRDNAGKYIKLFDYFVFTSTSEGFSIALLEGLREKVPIIVSDIPAFCECIEDNVTGYLFENNNADSLKLLIEKVVKRNVNDFVTDNGYNRFVSEFTFEKMIAKYSNLYNSIFKN